jgi:hypothetical protein
MRLKLLFKYDAYHDKYPFSPPFNIIVVCYEVLKFLKNFKTEKDIPIYLEDDKIKGFYILFYLII